METSTLEGSNVEMFSQKSLIYILVWKTYLLRFCWSFSFKGEHLFSNMKEVDACISSVVSATSQGPTHATAATATPITLTPNKEDTQTTDTGAKQGLFPDDAHQETTEIKRIEST
ncbi:uncharacterized protein [Rutidosis leptorrhynchoides]|uniref:uncharacterized protein isoform X1 n=1 Tax=Rutidosis leptorrhynchoides TaxID=125765 RepID=UPI003A9A0397